MISISLVLALLVGVLFTTGTYLVLRRDAIKLILGLGLLTYAINFILFGTSKLRRGIPPVVADKETFTGEISQFVDPLPQALILTAIVISFGITAFMVVLVNRRNALVERHQMATAQEPAAAPNDPFTDEAHHRAEQDNDPDDYVWLEYVPEAGSSDRRPNRQHSKRAAA